jgi:hypothetical protein
MSFLRQLWSIDDDIHPDNGSRHTGVSLCGGFIARLVSMPGAFFIGHQAVAVGCDHRDGYVDMTRAQPRESTILEAVLRNRRPVDRRRCDEGRAATYNERGRNGLLSSL